MRRRTSSLESRGARKQAVSAAGDGLLSSARESKMGVAVVGLESEDWNPYMFFFFFFQMTV